MTPVLDWARTRMRVAVFGPLVALLSTAALWSADGPVSATHAVGVVAGALLLVTQFRLWDDLEDRDRDAVAHPDRVLVHSPPQAFRLALTILALANAAVPVALGAWKALVALAAVDAAFLLGYRLRSRLPDVAWRYAILLAKYPVFVAVLASAQQRAVSPGRLAVAAPAVYAAACVYEALHDRPAGPGVRT